MSLSSQLISGSFALLGVNAAVLGFIIDRKALSPPFVFALVFAFIAICFVVASAYQGGLGISEIARSGLLGQWQLDTQRGRFHRQKTFMLVGTIAMYLAVGMAVLAPEKASLDFSHLSDRITAVENRVDALERGVERSKRVNP